MIKMFTKDEILEIISEEIEEYEQEIINEGTNNLEKIEVLNLLKWKIKKIIN